jgi:hypothetical protein
MVVARRDLRGRTKENAQRLVGDGTRLQIVPQGRGGRSRVGKSMVAVGENRGTVIANSRFIGR